MKNRSGFTLVEIGIVIAIFVILLTIGIPSTRVFIPNIELSSVAREISSELRYAAQQAVTEQINYIVKFNLATNTYSLYKIIDPEDPLTEIFVRENELSSTVEFQSITDLSDNQVRFNSAGAPSDSGLVVIKNTQENTKTLNIRPSGYVKIE